jgi:hypothetical protein
VGEIDLWLESSPPSFLALPHIKSRKTKLIGEKI